MGEPQAERRAGIYFPGIHGRGGAERLALQLAVDLVYQGWVSTLFTDVEVDRSQLEREFGAPLSAIRFHRLSTPRFSTRLPGELQRILVARSHARQMRSAHIDLFVNCRFRSSVPGVGQRNVYYAHFPHRLNVPVRGVAHRIYLSIMKNLDHLVVQRNSRGFVATYDRIWTNSEFTAAHVRDRWGVEVDVLYPPCRSISPLSKQKLIVVVSRFQTPVIDVPHKSQEYLIDAFSRLTELQHEGWSLVMIGGALSSDGPFIDRLRERAKDLPITLIPNASRVQLESILGQAQVYWHAQGVAGDPVSKPETQEHFGISVVEAMTAGALPVVFGTAGPAEIVADIPGITTWRNEEELVEITRHVAHLPPAELARTRAAARKRAEEFDGSHFAARLAALTEELEA